MVMTSYAKLPSPRTHPRDINKERLHLSLILQRSANHLPEPLVVVHHLMMHFLQACSGTLFSIRAGWFFLMT
jgi:hypothetical protein